MIVADENEKKKKKKEILKAGCVVNLRGTLRKRSHLTVPKLNTLFSFMFIHR